MKEKTKLFAKNLCFLSFVLMIFSCGFFGGINTCDTVTAVETYGYSEVNAYPSHLYVCGVPIGIKMQSDGVIVTGFIGFKNENDKFVNPSFDAGILVGDRIVSVSGEEVHSTVDLQNCIYKSTGSCDVNVIRNDEVCTITVTPDVSAESHQNKLGLWVKDNAAGIGTLTYINPENNQYGALGHGIGGAEYCGLFEMSDGTLYDAAIGGCVKGKSGSPGELQGYFLNSENENGIGNVETNCDRGIYGTISESVVNDMDEYGILMPVARMSEIYSGDATIISTVSGTTPKEYAVKIELIKNDSSETSKGMSIYVTDRDLLAETGGIVQGMSGSPILQDGKLIGAVTHVLVNDPTRGYGIFIENMLDR
ncbi:MAG: SpoIVB peptidase [Ruminococcaceae bacterium]|nr:SpoIVB peptidase [Oscillospiraceae bacterium]